MPNHPATLARLERDAPDDALGPLLARAVRERGGAPRADRPMLARRHGSMAMGALTWGNVRDWEKAVAGGHDDRAKTAAAVLERADRDKFIDLYLYKLDKHAADATKSFAYAASASEGLVFSALERAIVQGKSKTLKHIVSFFGTIWKNDKARARTFVVEHADAFLATGLPAMLARGPMGYSGNLKWLQEIVLDPEIARRMEEGDRATFVAEFPVLNVGHGASELEGGSVSEMVDAIFDSLIDGTLPVGYVGTASMAHPSTVLLDKSTEQRTMLDCHRLAGLFQDLVRAMPGMNLTVRSAEIYEAVMTRPMDLLPGGLIPQDFRGNVVDDHGNPTGRIFFAGEVGMNSHTYTVVGGRAYDPLFGTRGDEVAGSVGGLFQRMVDDAGRKSSTVWKQRGEERYLVKRARELNLPDNEHQFGTTYVLTANPAAHGAVITGWGIDLADELTARTRKEAQDELAALDRPEGVLA